MSMSTPTRLHLLNEFESAPNSALFNQNTVAAILNCSTQLLERNRWAGTGVPYIKMGKGSISKNRSIGFSPTTNNLSFNRCSRSITGFSKQLIEI